MDAGLAPVPDGHPEPQERVSEEEHPQKDDAKGRTVEEDGLHPQSREGVRADSFSRMILTVSCTR